MRNVGVPPASNSTIFASLPQPDQPGAVRRAPRRAAAIGGRRLGVGHRFQQRRRHRAFVDPVADRPWRQRAPFAVAQPGVVVVQGYRPVRQQPDVVLGAERIGLQPFGELPFDLRVVEHGQALRRGVAAELPDHVPGRPIHLEHRVGEKGGDEHVFPVGLDRVEVEEVGFGFLSGFEPPQHAGAPAGRDRPEPQMVERAPRPQQLPAAADFLHDAVIGGDVGAAAVGRVFGVADRAEVDVFARLVGDQQEVAVGRFLHLVLVGRAADAGDRPRPAVGGFDARVRRAVEPPHRVVGGGVLGEADVVDEFVREGDRAVAEQRGVADALPPAATPVPPDRHPVFVEEDRARAGRGEDVGVVGLGEAAVFPGREVERQAADAVAAQLRPAAHPDAEGFFGIERDLGFEGSALRRLPVDADRRPRGRGGEDRQRLAVAAHHVVGDRGVERGEERRVGREPGFHGSGRWRRGEKRQSAQQGRRRCGAQLDRPSPCALQAISSPRARGGRRGAGAPGGSGRWPGAGRARCGRRCARSGRRGRGSRGRRGCGC